MSTAKKLDVINEVAQIVTAQAGIQLGEKQRFMVEARLKKRMAKLGHQTDFEYLDYLRANLVTETQALISLLTTHHTYFFREFAHFEYISKSALPALIESARKRGDKKIKVWSAAASRGQEAYSLAMFLHYHLSAMAPDVTFEILGTDVDSESIEIARNGVYTQAEVKEIPLNYLGTHLARGTGEIADFVKIKKTLKEKCHFEVANLLNLDKKNPRYSNADIIFCRNVFIYFYPEQIKSITQSLLSFLQPQGFLFIGISESLHGLGLPVGNIGPSIYSHSASAAVQKANVARNLVSLPTGSTKAPAATQPIPAATQTRAESSAPKLIRVLCVDDSPTVLTLLKQILKPEFGFEIVGTAKNGLEAEAWYKSNQADIMTLDIHMPEKNGIEYLRSNARKPNHPPVVMISSVAREDAALAAEALKLGATDYVEKPVLAQLSERSDEIRIKLKCAIEAKNSKTLGATSNSVIQMKPQTISNLDQKLRVMICSLSSLELARSLMKEMTGSQPPTLLFIEGSSGVLPGLAKDGWKLIPDNSDQLEKGTLYLGDFKAHFSKSKTKFTSRTTSILILDQVSAKMAKEIETWSNAQIILNEKCMRDWTISPQVEIMPITSFSYLSCRYLGEAK